MKWWPMKYTFPKTFKITAESSQIAHSIGNFILKNFKTGHLKKNENVKKYDVHAWRHKIA